MVNVIWVLENIRKSINFYNPFDTKLILTSVSQWKKHNPNTYTVLYCDKLTYDTFSKIQLLEAWDDVKIIAPSEGIDKNIFWASAKVEVLQGINAPTVILDNDFVVYKSFEHLLKDNVIVAHDENGQDYYPDPLDPYVRRTNHLLNRPNHMSINCSFLYFPNYSQNYTKTINELFKKINLPILSETKYLILTNFTAIFQNQEVKFSGIIKNTSERPILTPRIKILGIREDRKIILEKILILEEKIISPSSEISFNKLVNSQINQNEENVSVKATLLKKIF